MTQHDTVRTRSPWVLSLVRSYGSHILVPLFLAAGMALAYLGAFHHPQPRHLEVAVVGEGPQTQVLAQTLTDGSDGALIVHAVGSVDDARAQIADRTLAAAYSADADHAELLVASASSETTAQIAGRVFQQLAFDQNLPFRTVDVVPTGAEDPTNQGLFFLLVALSVGGYSSALALAVYAEKLRPWVTAVLGIATSAAVAAIGVLVAGPLYGVIDHGVWRIFGLAWLYVAAILAIGVALHPVLGRWTTPTLTLLFVMLNFTSSGGIFQTELQPRLFAGLESFWNGAAWLDAAKSVAYFPAAGIGGDVVQLVAWLVVGVVAAGVTRVLVRRHRPAAELRGPLSEEEEVVAA
ncbi:hypothetical protein [Rhodococcus sp. HNM0569]|uniref:hypothetical protein n=1 Tax=Rhodococcus sp. HNM0569 TaxID=2716340 RepID=UPI00146E518A|nr:hypothetical protein [Rhodococcus sp. HNM0569]NLU83663.1 ABC transporter permease [Rhodococcus sp. HNM0569]